MKRRKVLAMLTTAVMTFTSLAPEGVLLVRAEDDATEAEAEVLPYGLTGMPDSYVPDAEELEMKAFLKENEALESLNGMTPGVDYVEGSVICLADDEEEAKTIAEAYNAELISYAQGVAELRLPESMSVADALSVAQDENYRLPVVEPNYLVHRVDPDIEDVIVSEEYELENAVEDGNGTDKAPEATWQDWVLGSVTAPAMLNNPDLYIKDPSSPYYQWYHETIGTYNAWATTMGSPDVTVAVIDDGVNPDHPDLKGRVTQVKVNNINPAAYTDSHATHVAGIIAASANNGIGGAGVAPKVKILSLNVFGTSESCATADEIRALNICIERGIKVVNMSLGGAGYSASEDLTMSQLAATGCCVLAAAGNENSGMKHYPAAFRDTISVGSVNIAGTRSRFS
ncbi:MAG: S8 family serine peptidase, partial [Lachnospiraceae bacterium]|nr:S8 family serine peptidase [Lachnospiraceae bacterium]